MIKLVPDPTFEHLVKLTVPGQPGTVDLQMTFRHMSTARMAEWFVENENRPSAVALAEIIEGWSGVMGEDGQYAPYSPQALETLLKNYHPATSEIVRAWQIGLTESRAKN